ncbi:uncharacterized protein LOC128627108 [Artibeus jamaicensis]|uniref:uncharacterized protein LOC128627108 n=1 Tax=Artibeus jamaicensis TaxID=9417 RepID=UPI00235B12E8|nr:uncharacterized protein LOC128627108 [Artibeus jamaicensis]
MCCRARGDQRREAARRTGPGPAAAARSGTIVAALPLAGIRELPGERGALGAPSSGTADSPLRKVQTDLGSGCRFPGGPGWDPGRAASCSLRAPLSSEGTRVKTHPTRGERGRRAGESRASGGRSSGLPPQRHPGDTGTPSSRYPACVDSCEPSGMVPRRPRRPESREWQPGGASAGTASSGWSSRRASTARTLLCSRSSRAKASGTPCPGRRGARRPNPPQAAPPPCQGRSKQETQDLTWRDPDFWPGFPLSRFRGKGPHMESYQIFFSLFNENSSKRRQPL